MWMPMLRANAPGNNPSTYRVSPPGRAEGAKRIRSALGEEPAVRCAGFGEKERVSEPGAFYRPRRGYAHPAVNSAPSGVYAGGT